MKELIIEEYETIEEYINDCFIKSKELEKEEVVIVKNKGKKGCRRQLNSYEQGMIDNYYIPALKHLDYKVGTIEYHIVHGYTKEEKIYEERFKKGLLYAEYVLTDLLRDLFYLRLEEYNLDVYCCDASSVHDKSIKLETKKCYSQVAIEKHKKETPFTLPHTYTAKKLIKDIHIMCDAMFYSTSDRENNLTFKLYQEFEYRVWYYKTGVYPRLDSSAYVNSTYKNIDIDIEITDDMINEYKFMKIKDEDSYIDNLVKDIQDITKRHKYRVEIQYRLDDKKNSFHKRLIKESWILRNKELLEYYYDNSIEYREYLSKNNLLDTTNKKAVMSAILKFIPNVTIMRRVKDYLTEIYGIEIVKKITDTKHNTKQKQYYKKKNKHLERDTIIKEKYTNIIIDLYMSNKLSLNKIKINLEQELTYDIPIRLIKKTLVDNKIEIR